MGRKEINTDNLDVTGLEFDDATHTYRLDGFEIPSVSAIMVVLLPPFSESLEIPLILQRNIFNSKLDPVFNRVMYGSPPARCPLKYFFADMRIFRSRQRLHFQLEAYAKALENIGVKVERKRILHLKKNGEFEYRELHQEHCSLSLQQHFPYSSSFHLIFLRLNGIITTEFVNYCI